MRTGFAELAQTVPVPRVVFGKIVLAEPIEGMAFAAARPRHLEERTPDIRRVARPGRMLVAPAVVPKSRSRHKEGSVLGEHVAAELIEILGEASPHAPRCPAGWTAFQAGIGCGVRIIGNWRQLAAPQRRFHRAAYERASADGEPAVSDGKLPFWFLDRVGGDCQQGRKTRRV